MKRISLLLIVLMGLMAGCAQQSQEKETANQEAQITTKGTITVLAPDAYLKALEGTPDAQRIDVRTPGEYNEGHLEGFALMNYQGDFATEAKTLDPSKPVFLHCRSGARSAAASEVLIEMGFQSVTDLKGGILAWEQSNLPIVK